MVIIFEYIWDQLALLIQNPEKTETFFTETAEQILPEATWSVNIVLGPSKRSYLEINI